MERKSDIQCNKIYHLEDTMIMYGIYNSDNLVQLIETVHRMHNHHFLEVENIGRKTQPVVWNSIHITDGIGHYAIDSILFLSTIREKYVRMYERFLEQLKMYTKVIGILSKGYLPISLLSPSKLEEILNEVKRALKKTNKD